jgi:hypothetical protein
MTRYMLKSLLVLKMTDNIVAMEKVLGPNSFESWDQPYVKLCFNVQAGIRNWLSV